MNLSKEKGVTGSQKQENIQKMETLPLALEKFEDERKNPPAILKKIDLAVDGKEKLIFIVEGLKENFELALIALLRNTKTYLFGLIKTCQD